MLAKAIQERRVVEALQKQRHRPLRDPSVSLVTRLLLNLGNRLVDLGGKLKTQTAATPPTEPAVG
jgi:hypothetical protein